MNLKRADRVYVRHRGLGAKACYFCPPVQVVVATQSIPLEQPVWSCAYRDCGLPNLPRWTLEKSPDAHMKQYKKR